MFDPLRNIGMSIDKRPRDIYNVSDTSLDEKKTLARHCKRDQHQRHSDGERKPSVANNERVIPRDSPQLTMQTETIVVRKYIDTVRWRFTATKVTENKRGAVISNGISKKRHEELTDYALSAYSCRAFEST